MSYNASKVRTVGRTRNGEAFLTYRDIDGRFRVNSITAQPEAVQHGFRELVKQIIKDVKYIHTMTGMPMRRAAVEVAKRDQEILL